MYRERERERERNRTWPATPTTTVWTTRLMYTYAIFRCSCDDVV